MRPSSSPASWGSRRSTRSAVRRRSRRSRTAPRRSTRSTRSSARAACTSRRRSCSSRVASGSTCPPARARSSSSRTARPTRSASPSDLLAQAEHGADSEAILFTDDGELADRVTALVSGSENVRVERVEIARRRDRALGVLRPRAPRAPRRRPGGAPCAGPQRRLGLRRLLVRRRRLRGRRDTRAADGRARAVDGRARPRGVPQAASRSSRPRPRVHARQRT